MKELKEIIKHLATSYYKLGEEPEAARPFTDAQLDLVINEILDKYVVVEREVIKENVANPKLKRYLLNYNEVDNEKVSDVFFKTVNEGVKK